MIDPQYPVACTNKGVALAKLGRSQEALEVLNMALEIGGDHPEILSIKAGVLVDLDRHRDALAVLDRALALDRMNSDTWAKKGAVLVKLERYPEALEALDLASLLAQALIRFHLIKFIADSSPFISSSRVASQRESWSVVNRTAVLSKSYRQ